jgi:hypothetical protein
MSIKDALKLKSHKTTTASGLDILIRRPSTLDLLAAMEESKDRPNTFGAWLVFNHLIDENGKVFLSIEEVLQCDVALVEEVAREVEKLYGEGKN